MFQSLEEIVLSVLAIIIIAIFIGCLYAFFRAVFLFIFSSGDADKIKQAWNSIRYMILGVILTIVILFLFPVILSKAHFVGYETFNAQSIFNQATKIARAVLNFGKDADTTYRQTKPTNYYPDDSTANDNVNDADKEPTIDDYEDLEL